MFTNRCRIMALAAIAFVACLPGCARNKNAGKLAAMNASNIQRVSNLYAAFQNMKGGRGPNDDAEFKNFIKEYAPDKLSAMGVDANNLDGVFTSERDGKPFKIRYKVGGGRGSLDAVVFEQAGQNGVKQVGFTGGKVEEMGDSAYQQAWGGKGESNANSLLGGARPTGRPEGAPTGP